MTIKVKFYFCFLLNQNKPIINKEINPMNQSNTIQLELYLHSLKLE
jgi:hypothetical protein